MDARILLLVTLCTVLVSGRENNVVTRDGKAIGEFVVIGTTEYFFSSELVDMLTSIRSCNELGMKVITLYDSVKNTAIKTFIEKYDILNGRSYWTSGRKFRDMWQWTGTGQNFQFKDWSSTMPSYSLLEDVCVGVSHLGWFDNACKFDGNRYICEHLY